MDDWLLDSIEGRISPCSMRLGDRELRLEELAGEMSLLDPFCPKLKGLAPAPPDELGPAILKPEPQDRPNIDCEDIVLFKQRLNRLTRGLVDKVVGIEGLLVAGGAAADVGIRVVRDLCVPSLAVCPSGLPSEWLGVEAIPCPRLRRGLLARRAQAVHGCGPMAPRPSRRSHGEAGSHLRGVCRGRRGDWQLQEFVGNTDHVQRDNIDFGSVDCSCAG